MSMFKIIHISSEVIDNVKKDYPELVDAYYKDDSFLFQDTSCFNLTIKLDKPDGILSKYFYINARAPYDLIESNPEFVIKNLIYIYR